MKNWRKYEAIALLMCSGFAIGGIIVLAKTILASGISSILLAFIQFFVSSVCLFVILTIKKAKFPFSWTHIRFYFWCAVLGTAGPFFIVFIVVPHLGAGLTSTAYVFPPLVTYLMALFIRMESFNIVRAMGLALGFIGAMGMLYVAGSLGGTRNWMWLSLLFCMPLVVSWGNIYRSKHWPENLQILAITTGILFFSALIFVLPAIISVTNAPRIIVSPYVLIFTLLQALLTAIAYLMFFRLQKIGGAVYISQAGYIITATGMMFGYFVYNETYPAMIWVGVLCASAGVLIVTAQQARNSKNE